MTRRRRRDPYARMVVLLPERDLAESVLHLAAPLLEPLGPTSPPEQARRAIELAILLWNAHVTASKFWGDPRPKPLADLRWAMCGKQARPGLADLFELLSARWQKEFAFDPRLVAEWSLDAADDGRHRLVCQMVLPEGVEAEVPPPIEKRIAIGGQFLDEVQTRLDASSSLVFPVDNHRGVIGSDGVATIYAKMPSALQLFAEGRLPPIGAVPVDVVIGGKNLGPMLLTELRCASESGRHDVAVLVFRPANAAAP